MNGDGTAERVRRPVRRIKSPRGSDRPVPLAQMAALTSTLAILIGAFFLLFGRGEGGISASTHCATVEAAEGS